MIRDQLSLVVLMSTFALIVVLVLNTYIEGYPSVLSSLGLSGFLFFLFIWCHRSQMSFGPRAFDAALADTILGSALRLPWLS